MTDQKPYIVSARKYRPATFNTVVGQKALTATLKNAIASHRLAQAYLFCGPRGVGKTSCARIFAKTINCLSPTPDGEACGHCDSCRAIEQGNSFNLVELDAASNNSVDDIRSITEQVNVPPQNGQYRVFIIDEVHMLSNAAFNAFLKTLEEPPKYVVFILATTEKHKVIPTILSRCQIYDFKRITVNDMIDHLEYVASQEGIATDREALGIISLKADGAMRDALSIFDQVAASSRGQVTYRNTIENLNVLDYDYYFRLVDAFRDGDIPSALLIYKEVRDKGFDSLFFVNGLAAHVRDLMVAADPRTVPLLETSEEVSRRYVEQAPTHHEPQPASVPQGQPSRPRPANRPSTFRLSDPGVAASASAGHFEQRTSPFSHDDFMQAWGEFIARNPSLHILVNTMRGARPEKSGDNAYRIVVDHPAQLQAFELSMPKLLEFLRDFLKNDLLTLKVEVNTAPVDNKQLPPKEFLRQVVNDNPAFARFLTSLDAELM